MNGFKILCVEDNLETQRMLSFLLTEAGYEVITADDGKQGLEKARAWRPALILMDLMMPGMSGITAIRHLRADPVTKDIPVLVLSAYREEALIEEAKAAGADDYLSKTILPANLTEIIDTYLRVGSAMLTKRVTPLPKDQT